jgi:hypothetical protein
MACFCGPEHGEASMAVNVGTIEATLRLRDELSPELDRICERLDRMQDRSIPAALLGAAAAAVVLPKPEAALPVEKVTHSGHVDIVCPQCGKRVGGCRCITPGKAQEKDTQPCEDCRGAQR